MHDIQRKIQAQTETLPVEVLLVRRSRAQRHCILAGAQQKRPSANCRWRTSSPAVWRWKRWKRRSSSAWNSS
ncbi:hypothetical protein ACLK2E_02300 [Escherichia coli]